jgi:hypothetical protein
LRGARSGARRGASRLRRFILENDLLEALIALPEQLFLRILADLKDGDEFERQRLKRDLVFAPAWIAEVLRRIAEER